MKGWIIYSGEFVVDKIYSLISQLVQKAEKYDLSLQLVKNNEVVIQYDLHGKISVETLDKKAFPDFVIFWDKDIVLAKALEIMGIRLFNSATSIEFCDNKEKTLAALSKIGLPTPKTIIAPFVYKKQNLSNEFFEYLESELSFPMVVKECYGSFGMQVYLAESRIDILKFIDLIQNRPFLFQEFIKESEGRDKRIMIVGNQIVGAMLRENPTDFRANISNGGRGTEVSLTNEEKRVALLAHETLGLDFSGVDLLFGKNNSPILCEVNSNVNYLSYEKISNKSIADEILKYITRKMVEER